MIKLSINKSTFSKMSLVMVVLAIVMPSGTLLADTGGYPWNDAVLLRASTYDWGYPVCQPAMRAANMCSGHTSYKSGVKYYQSDPWHYDVRNCTSYVAWRVHRDTGINIPGWGNANNWDNAAARKGYKVDTTPAVGSIAVWEPRLGHVAYVTQVAANGSVTVDQYNKAGKGEFSTRSNVRASKYIHLSVAATPATSTQPTSDVVASSLTVSTAVPAQDVPKPALPKELEPIELKPLAAIGPEATLPKQQGISYSVAIDQVEQVAKTYAVQYQGTKSGYIEVNQSNYQDGNTTWSKQWVTNQKVIPIKQKQDYLLADVNSDKQLDLYIVNAATETTNASVNILSGASDYKESINESTTSLVEEGDTATSYSVSDYDGNGSLDLYAVTYNYSDKLKLTVLDGSDQYKKAIISTVQPTTPTKGTRYYIADHDQDGRGDIYSISPKSDQAVSVAVAVFNTPQTTQVLRSWDATYQ